MGPDGHLPSRPLEGTGKRLGRPPRMLQSQWVAGAAVVLSPAV